MRMFVAMIVEADEDMAVRKVMTRATAPDGSSARSSAWRRPHGAIVRVGCSLPSGAWDSTPFLMRRKPKEDPTRAPCRGSRGHPEAARRAAAEGQLADGNGDESRFDESKEGARTAMSLVLDPPPDAAGNAHETRRLLCGSQVSTTRTARTPTTRPGATRNTHQCPRDS